VAGQLGFASMPVPCHLEGKVLQTFDYPELSLYFPVIYGNAWPILSDFCPTPVTKSDAIGA
jgi:hypothetical protein